MVDVIEFRLHKGCSPHIRLWSFFVIRIVDFHILVFFNVHELL